MAKKPKKIKGTNLSRYTVTNPPPVTDEEKQRNAVVDTELGWWNRFDSPKVVEFYD